MSSVGARGGVAVSDEAFEELADGRRRNERGEGNNGGLDAGKCGRVALLLKLLLLLAAADFRVGKTKVDAVSADQARRA